jgi:hypothetical protein
MPRFNERRSHWISQTSEQSSPATGGTADAASSYHLLQLRCFWGRAFGQIRLIDQRTLPTRYSGVGDLPPMGTAGCDRSQFNED